MLRFRLLGGFLVLFAFALIGCGGGGGGTLFNIITTADTTGGATGGGSTGAATLAYQTTWAGTPQAPTGQSQRVIVRDAAGGTVTQRVVNQGSGTQSIAFSSLPAGFQWVRVELFSGPDATGTLTGYLETVIQGGSTVETVVGLPPTRLQVEPPTSTMTVGSTQHVNVAGVASSGALTFLQPGSVTWSATGGAVTIDQNGNATAVAPGTSTVTARHSTGLTGSTTITVTDPSRSQWTVMVFLNAANDLYPYAPLDMNEMERVAGNDQVRFVVQWKQVQGVGGNQNPLFSGTRRYLVRPDATNAIASQVVQNMGNVDMGSPGALLDFVRWAKQNYPAQRYALIVWNHGNGWRRSRDGSQVRAISYDDQTGNAIQIWQLPAAMQGERVDIFSFDACLMQMLEVVAEIRDVADYIVASEENTPGYGYPYDRIFAPWVQNPGAPTVELARAMVTGHARFEGYQNDTVTQSAVDTSRVGSVVAAVDQLARALLANREAVSSLVQTVRNTSMKYAFRGDGRYFYDLWDIANRLDVAGSPEAVRVAARNVKSAVDAAVAAEAHTQLSAGSHGISIDFSPATRFDAATYRQMRIARETQWDEWLSVAP